jgi:hypothetical protein
VSRVVEIIFAAELEPARVMGRLIERVLEPGMTRYQFLDALLELSAAIARIRRGSSDAVFQQLNSVPRSHLSAEIDRVLGQEYARAGQELVA